MNDARRVCGCPDRCVLELLLDLMKVRGAPPWPGADGLTLEEVLDEYPRAAREGRVPDADELCRRYPRLAAEIRLASREGFAAEFLARCQRKGERGTGGTS
jgi:hypothetical protein